MLYIIYMYICYIYIIKVDYVINGIHGKAAISDLSTQIRKLVL